MSLYYDLYQSGNPRQLEEEQPLYARVIPSGTLTAKQFIGLVSKANGFSEAILEGCLQAITDELQCWLKQGWIVEVGELGHFSVSLKCSRPVMTKKEIRSPSIHINKVNLRINKDFRNKFTMMKLERMESPYRSHSNRNDDECRKMLMQHLKTQGCINQMDFMHLTGISRKKAINLLNEYIEEGIIRKYGGGKSVVYLPKQVVEAAVPTT